MRDQGVIGGFLTAPGDGALQVLRVSGRGVPDLLGRVFRPRATVAANGSGPRLGQLLDGDRVIDEVLLHLDDEGRYAEITTHGGALTKRAVEELLHRQGVDLVDPELLVEGDVLRPPGREVDREAITGLTRSWAKEAVLFHLEALQRRLVREVAMLRVALDSGAYLDGPPRATLRLSDRLRTLVERARFGMAFTEPPRVVLAGRPNAGKSTLANALFERERCLVTAEEGTTRDVVRDRLSIEGFPFELLDTAGLRRTEDEVEREGTARTVAALEQDAIALLLHPLDEGPVGLGSVLAELPRRPDLLVLTKADLLAPDPGRATDYAARFGVPAVEVSCVGAVDLTALRRRLLARSPFAGPCTREIVCPFTARQKALLEDALEHHEAGDSGTAARALDELLEGPAAS